MFKEPIVSVPSPVQERHSGMDSFVDVESTKSSHSPDVHEIILLSDSEDNLLAPDVSSEEVLSSVMENDASTASNMLKEATPLEQRTLNDDRHVPLEPQICHPVSNISASSKPVSTDSRDNIAASKGLLGIKKPRLLMNTNNNSTSSKVVKLSVTGTSQQPRPKLLSDTEKFKSIFRDLSDDEDDPLEHALDNYRRPQILSRKPSILVPKRQAVQLPVPVGRKPGSGSRVTSTRRLQPPKLGSWFRNILEMDYFAVVGLSSSEILKNPALKEVPVCFDSPAQYVEIFQPLVLEEFKAQLQNAYVETPPDDMMCGSISILSVERVDDFLIVRARPEHSQSIKFRGCSENDLVLLTKDPLKNQGQQVHVLGKVQLFPSLFASPMKYTLLSVVKYFSILSGGAA
jgi:senataxin